jgi:hypothetical protein
MNSNPFVDPPTTIIEKRNFEYGFIRNRLVRGTTRPRDAPEPLSRLRDSSLNRHEQHVNEHDERTDLRRRATLLSDAMQVLPQAAVSIVGIDEGVAVNDAIGHRRRLPAPPAHHLPLLSAIELAADE